MFLRFSNASVRDLLLAGGKCWQSAFHPSRNHGREGIGTDFTRSKTETRFPTGLMTELPSGVNTTLPCL
jgi:hypothetical protein